jgi:hypothetical protein
MSIVPAEQSTVVHQSGDLLHAQMDYARAVQSANMLPAAYRGKPADIMLAVGLGSSDGPLAGRVALPDQRHPRESPPPRPS